MKLVQSLRSLGVACHGSESAGYSETQGDDFKRQASAPPLTKKGLIWSKRNLVLIRGVN
jgi:hypothetical protein